MLNILAWVVGVGLVLFGSYGLVQTAKFAKGYKELCHREAALMRESGQFPGEPDYMKEFRATNAEFDAESEPKIIWMAGLIYGGIPLLLGICLLTFVGWRTWF